MLTTVSILRWRQLERVPVLVGRSFFGHPKPASRNPRSLPGKLSPPLALKAEIPLLREGWPWSLESPARSSDTHEIMGIKPFGILERNLA